MPVPINRSARLRAALDELADRLEAVRFALPGDQAERRRSLRERSVISIRRYLLPRLGASEEPLLVAVFGPTGSGKSTLVNSLAGQQVSTPGVLRPTTRSAVVWCHRRHRDLYPGRLAETGPVEVVPDDHPLLADLTLVDTPDVDSHVVEHRRQTEQVLGMADAAIYVTTAQRYADAVPWEILADLAARDLPLLVVANRMGRRSSGAVADLASLLREARIGALRSDDIVTIQEQRLRGGERLPQAAVRRVGEHLSGLGGQRQAVLERTVGGAIGVAVAGSREVAAEVRNQAAEGEGLWEAARLAYRQQGEEIATHLRSGELVRGEVVGRWQRLVGVGELAALVARGVGRLRDMVLPRDPVRAADVQQVEAEAREELVDLVLFRARRAVASSAAAWELDVAGRSLLQPELRTVGPELRERAEAEVDAWLAELVTLVRDVGRSRFHLARAASLGVNAAATMLLIGVFVSTGGITGAEVGITAGAAAAQQSILEHLFGGAAARRLAQRARDELQGRLERVLESDAARFRDAIEAAVDAPERAEAIEEAAGQVEIEAEDRARRP